MEHGLYNSVIDSPVGKIGIKVANKKLVTLAFIKNDVPLLNSTSEFAHNVVQQLNLYFANPKYVFDIPLYLKGTPLHQRIWRRMLRIPSGTTVTYNDLAKQFDTNARVIGNACRANPVPIIVPCHRVVATNGPGGYCGKTKGEMLNIKMKLLAHELFDEQILV
jgi:methylated-DNA-[protein]-cysteine S-methyltransferase